MASIVPVQLDTVNVGSASNFRSTINTNFSKLQAKVQEIIETNTTIVLSPTQPSTQREGDLWLRELP